MKCETSVLQPNTHNTYFACSTAIPTPITPTTSTITPFASCSSSNSSSSSSSSSSSNRWHRLTLPFSKDNVHSAWSTFTKKKNQHTDFLRLEYVAWRIWFAYHSHRHHHHHHHQHPHSHSHRRRYCCSPSSASTSISHSIPSSTTTTTAGTNATTSPSCAFTKQSHPYYAGTDSKGSGDFGERGTAALKKCPKYVNLYRHFYPLSHRSFTLKETHGNATFKKSVFTSSSSNSLSSSSSTLIPKKIGFYLGGEEEF